MVSEFASSTGRGGELGVGSLRLRRREGGRRGCKVKVVELDLERLQWDWEQ